MIEYVEYCGEFYYDDGLWGVLLWVGWEWGYGGVGGCGGFFEVDLIFLVGGWDWDMVG